MGSLAAATGYAAWIREHEVTWEIVPHVELNEQTRVRVGYDLTLFARHPEPLHDDPGCPECHVIHETLRDIALHALPQADSHSHVEIAPFQPAFHLRPETHFAPEVSLDVEVTHQHVPVTPADADQEAYMQRLKRALEEMGVQPKIWRNVAR